MHAAREREEVLGSEHSDRLAEGKGEGAERVRAKLKVMQETVMGIQAGGTVTALPGMTENESCIFKQPEQRNFFFACASGALF